MTADEPHWSEQPAPAVERAEAIERTAAVATPLAAVARQAADVSPAWAAVTVAEAALPAAPPPVVGRDRAIGVEAIREGWLLHRGASRIAPGASPDLALLVGDWCYAAGLCSIADHGSLDDVATLATLVADVSARAAEPVEALEPTWQQALDRMTAG